MADKKLKVLIVRFSSIGDIVLTTPVIRGLKQQAGAEVHFLTKKAFRSLVDANPFVDRVFAIDKRVGEVLPDLRREKYDHLIDLHRNLRSGQVKRDLSAKNHSFDKINLAKWLRVNLRVDRLPDLHIVDRYLEPVRKLGIGADGAGLDYFIPEAEQVDLKLLARRVFPDDGHWRAQLQSGAYLGLVIGAAHATKRLPPDLLTELAGQLPKPLLLLGGPGDREVGERIAVAIPGVVNTCGDFSLHGSASLIDQGAGLITHDTGLMHIGAALGKRMVVVWGNTIPEFGMYPYDPEDTGKAVSFEVDGLSCRPCSKIGYQTCPKGHFACMRRQPLAQIARVAGSWL